ncbi:hypothetical protein MRB53_020544 [Persea americana]|uniref:Uncharacterized protein n=1 Tax=Persea americana TaxID=3435 RepID=A0ACC2L171_PERAE|nr:hypothetical protein MRB53_020544 [Persea americana]
MDGINHFMEFTNGFDNEFSNCLCRKCVNRYCYRREFVREHLILNGFFKQYKNWIRHGKEYVSCPRVERDENEVDDMSETDPMIVMLNDIACGLAPEYTSSEIEGAGGSNPRSGAMKKRWDILKYWMMHRQNCILDARTSVNLPLLLSCYI